MKLLTVAEKILIRQRLINGTTYKDSRCWIFKHSTSTSRYGQLRVDYKLQLTHRLSAAIFLNLDLDNDRVQVNHKPECTSAYCWNPDHLYIGTQAENMKDVSERMRDENRICKSCGHFRSLVTTTSRGKRIKRLECNNCRKLRYRKNKNV